MADDTVNQRLNFLIKELGLNPSSFSRALGVSETTTRNYTTRTSKPGFEYLEKIAVHFKQVNLAWLMTGEGEHLLTGAVEERGIYQTSQNNSHSQVIGIVGRDSITKNHGTPPSSLSNELAAAKREIELLQAQVADKERTIQILLNQSSKP